MVYTVASFILLSLMARAELPKTLPKKPDVGAVAQTAPVVAPEDAVTAAPAKAQAPAPAPKRTAPAANSETAKQSEALRNPESLRKRTYVGVDGGLSADLVVSDTKTGVFGAGLGKQIGLYGSFFGDKPTGLKVRVEYVNFEQQILNSKPQDSVITNGYLKTMQQNYWLASMGAEFRNEGLFGRQFFWEAALGYAFGQPSQYTVILEQTSDEVHSGFLNPASGPFLGLGTGFRRQFRDNWTSTFAFRSIVTIKSAFGEPFDGELYIPVPFMFSFGVERTF
ncbi:MAG: hypothetical protein ABL958_11985 [Bdellovibrionia bacterium]